MLNLALHTLTTCAIQEDDITLDFYFLKKKSLWEGFLASRCTDN